jgi:hypothetical protein
MSQPWVELGQTLPHAAAFEHAALDILDRDVGYDAAFFLSRGSESGLAVRGITEATLRTSLAPGNPYEQEFAPLKRAARATRGVTVDTALLGSTSVERTAYFRDLVRPSGGRHTLFAYLSLRGEIFGLVVLGRNGRTFNDREVTSVEGGLPALALARAAFAARFPAPDHPLPHAPSSLVRRVFRRPLEELDRRRLSDGSRVLVRDRDGHREMVSTDGEARLVWSRSSLTQPHVSGWPYLDLFHVAAGLAGRRESALFIGCGGGVAVRQFARTYPGIVIDVVDSEAVVFELASRWFGLDAIPGVSTHVADGAAFVRAARARWDIIVIDAYATGPLGDAFSSSDFFSALTHILRPGGVVACNVIGTLGGDGQVAAVVAAAATAFSDVRMLPVVEKDERDVAGARRNVVVIARA